MKTIRSIFLLLLCAGTTWAQTNIVVPNNLANVEGNSSVSEPFNSTSFRFQQVFDASQFAIPLGMSGRIDSISFRLDGASTENVLLFFGGASATLSTTQLEPDGLSPTFAENRGLNSVTIWNGGLSLGGFPQPGAMPQPWPFQPPIATTIGGTPFFYIPSQGNLLLEVAGVAGQAFLPGALDGHSVAGDSISWVFSNSNLTPSGSTETFGLVTRFNITVVPEPAIWQLLLIGILAAAILWRKHQRTALGFKAALRNIPHHSIQS